MIKFGGHFLNPLHIIDVYAEEEKVWVKAIVEANSSCYKYYEEHGNIAEQKAEDLAKTISEVLFGKRQIWE